MLRELFRSFHAKRASADEVMRAFMAYDAWQAPILYASEMYGTQSFERVAVWGTGMLSSVPAGELWCFTDDAAALDVVNKGATVGPYATGLVGHRLFKNLPEVGKVYVNPASPGNGWVIEPRAFAITRLWASALEVESFFAKPEGLLPALVGYDGFTILTHPNGSVASAVGAAGMRSPGMLFTSPDCADRVLHEAGPQVATSLKQNVVSGKQLFLNFAQLGVDGFIVNPRGPGAPFVLTGQMCEAIRSYADAVEKEAFYRAQAERLEDT
jgi:hypothetical protein